MLEFENNSPRLYKSQDGNSVPDEPSNPNPNVPPRGTTLVAAGLLLAALALVVLYTSSGAFRSPLALVVVAAIGMAALLLQLRLRPDLSFSVGTSSLRGPLWLNIAGVLCAVGAVVGDVLHLESSVTLVAALAAILCFAVGGIIVLSALRKRRG